MMAGALAVLQARMSATAADLRGACGLIEPRSTRADVRPSRVKCRKRRTAWRV